MSPIGHVKCLKLITATHNLINNAFQTGNPLNVTTVVINH